MLPTYSAFARTPFCRSLPDEEIESDAMAADDHEVGRLELVTEQLHGDRRAGIDDLRVLIDRDEAVGAAECGDGAGALAHRIRGEPGLRVHQPDEQVFGASALRIHAHRQRRRDRLPAIGHQTGDTRESPARRTRGT